MVALPKIYNVHFVAIIATLGGALYVFCPERLASRAHCFGFDMSSMSAIVGAIGSAVAGPMSEKFGRRDSIMFACVSCRNYGQLIAGRVLNGFTVGITLSQVPVYLAEIARPEKRGSLVIVQQLAIEAGILIMYFIGHGCSKIDSTASFCTAWGTQFIPAAFLIAGLPFLPRSPRWLAKVGREKEAIETLANIQAGASTEDPLVIVEWEEIVTTMRAEREAGRGWRKFFHDGMWKRILAGMSQLAGANVIVYYLTYIAQMAGLTGDVGMVTSGIQYAVFIIFTRVMWVFIDRTGRRTLLVWGALGMGFCHLVIGGVMGAHHTEVPGGVGDPPNANVVIAVNPGAPRPTPSSSSQVSSLGTRATGMSMAAMSNWVFNFALGMFTPPALQNITWRLFIIFGVLCIVAAAYFFLTYPEACGKTLEEVEAMFDKDGPLPWKTKKGESRLEAEIEAVMARKTHGEPEVAESEKV
ncbi:putative sugar transporter-like protein [Phialemonium atrogriseum]|uniref:Sugar transporter-like protein n=1 Tax=Phialemonium atrogriseum TaxID=1093897 RepID=A0AAJ0FJB5_9PEZI|nr:putative sugar transporter-like protein [Phialemonium atrogriseum]KAK1762945.1 putative sugar transporter-like protein [Phialemonium atrogriseum]